MFKRQHKEESGAQLLARLCTRVSLIDIDPKVFGSSTLPSALKTSSGGKIIELYGTEGVGKTQLAMHYIAKACLPSQWKTFYLHGIGTKVIIIDTEFKFSVLQLALVLEKQILGLAEKLKQQSFSGGMQSEFSEPLNQDSSSIRKKEMEAKQLIVPVKTSSITHTLFGKNTTSQADLSSGNVLGVAEEVDKVIVMSHDSCGSSRRKMAMEEVSDCIVKSIDASDKVHEMSSADLVIGREIKKKALSTEGDSSTIITQQSQHRFQCQEDSREQQSLSFLEGAAILSPQDVEAIVQDSLGRVQVMRVCSVEQLLISLLSLEAMLSYDPLISMVVIDTISAFYWTDKLADLENTQRTESRMSPIAGTISRFVSEFGMTFLVTKSALIRNKRRWEEEHEDTKRISANECGDHLASSSNWQNREKALWEHADFLGKSWSALSVKRIVITKACGLAGRVERIAWCSDWPIGRPFTFLDDNLQFL